MPTISTQGVGWDLSDATRSDAALRRFLHGLPGVDQVGAEARAAALGTRSIKTTAKAQALDLAIRMVDLTTLEGQDTPGKVRTLASKAMRPDPTEPTCPATAARSAGRPCARHCRRWSLGWGKKPPRVVVEADVDHSDGGAR